MSSNKKGFPNDDSIVNSTRATQGTQQRTNRSKSGAYNSKHKNKDTADRVEQTTRIVGNVLKGASSALSIASTVAKMIQVAKSFGDIAAVVAQDPAFYSHGLSDQDLLTAQEHLTSDMISRYNMYATRHNGVSVTGHYIALTTGNKEAWNTITDEILMAMRVNLKSNLNYTIEDVRATIWAVVNVYLAYKIIERGCRLAITQTDYQRDVNVSAAGAAYANNYASYRGQVAHARNFFDDMSDYGSEIRHQLLMFEAFVRKVLRFDANIFSLIDSVYGAIYADSLTENPSLNILIYASRYCVDLNHNYMDVGDAPMVWTSTDVANMIASIQNTWNPTFDIVLADISRIPGVKPHSFDAKLVDLPLPIIYDEGMRLKIRNATVLGYQLGAYMSWADGFRWAALPVTGSFFSQYGGVSEPYLQVTIPTYATPVEKACIWSGMRWYAPGWTNSKLNGVHDDTCDNALRIASGDVGSGVRDLISQRDYAWTQIDCPKDRLSGDNLIELTRLCTRWTTAHISGTRDWDIKPWGGPEIYMQNMIMVNGNDVIGGYMPSFNHGVSQNIIGAQSISPGGSQSEIVTNDINARTQTVLNEMMPLGTFFGFDGYSKPAEFMGFSDYDKLAVVSVQTVESADQAATIALFRLRG